MISPAEVIQLNPKEWSKLAENAHLLCFNEKRPWDLDRIDYALIGLDQGVPSSYATVRELDKESVYWQYGGAFPNAKNSMKAFRDYQGFIEWTAQNYKRITTLIANDNLPMLKMAMHCGFRVIGIRYFEGTILLELMNKLNTEA